MIKECQNCKKEKEHHAKGLCYTCYKKVHFKPKIKSCKRCKRSLPIHAKNLCPGCYNSVYHSDKNKAYNQRKSNNVDLKTFRKVTESCVICGFDKIVDLHHIDKNKKNNDPKNLIGLCPNHHRMVNNHKFRLEIWHKLEKLGLDIPINKP